MSRQPFNKIYLIISLLFMLVATSTDAHAQTSPVTLDPEYLEPFFDGFMAAQLAERPIAGATLSIVQDGKLIFAKGYGYADVANNIAADPEQTLFRIGSVSKLFTWTAIMQLVEQGKLDLNTDVNEYLDFVIPDTYAGRPITLQHLLTHTPGFEDRGIGLMAATPEQLISNGQWLAENIPTRVRPAGELASYSNYGVALAGYIVEQVSNMPYADYIEQNIFQPLNMQQTSSRQPLPDPLSATRSHGYTFEQGRFKSQPFELIIPAPAGSASASATDMARFMLAHLNAGELEGARILEAATVQQMHSQLFTHDTHLNGVAYGFYELNQNGQRVIGHGGSTTWFHTQLALIPEQNLGLFVSFNTQGTADLPETLLATFMDEFFPVEQGNNSAALPNALTRANQVAGSYRPIRMSYTTPEKLLTLAAGFYATVTEEGGLTTTSPFGVNHFVEIEPYVYQEVDGDEYLVAKVAADGQVTHIFVHSLPTMALEKLAWYESQQSQLLMLFSTLLLFISTLIAALVNYFVKRRLSALEQPRPRLAIIARWVLGAAALLSLLLFIVIVIGTSDMQAMTTGNIPIFSVVPPLAWSIVGLAGTAVAFTVLAWVRHYWGWVARLHYTVVTVAALYMVWFMAYWQLLFGQF